MAGTQKIRCVRGLREVIFRFPTSNKKPKEEYLVQMRRIVSLLFAVAMAFVMSGCGKEKPTLHLFCWADYVAPELIAKFEKENGCKIVYDTFDSNEALLAKLQAGATGYDLIFPSHYVLDMLANKGLISQLDHTRLEMLDRLDKEVLAKLPDPECEFSVPYMLSYTGIGYNNEVLKDIEPSWGLFNRTDLNRRACMLDDKREVIGAALIYLGFDPNSTDTDELAKAMDVIRGWMRNVCKLENEQYKNGIASREFTLVMGYSGDIAQVVEENPHVTFAIPKEGTAMSCDVLAIPSSARNIDLAYKFINFIHDPANAAENMEFTQYLCPNTEACGMASEELKANPAVFVDKDVFAKCRFINDQGENEHLFNEMWDDIKAGR